MTARQLTRLLRRRDCEVLRQKGSHQIWRCGECRTVVPIHTGDIPKGTLRSIERDLELCLGDKWLTR
ncbi:MAG: type II toxin-antitoxin system HicA family toxin [Acidimicrobiia bacterium]|nr:type II toxin-antitoxin system HicA family toxin [Acidimicrobiia bacterium]